MNTFSLNDAKQYLEDLRAEEVRQKELKKAREEEDRETVLWHLDFCFQRDGKLLVDNIKDAIAKTRNPNNIWIQLHALGNFDKFCNPDIQLWDADTQRYRYIQITPSINSAIEAEFEIRFPGYKVSRKLNGSKEYGLSFEVKE